MNYKFVFIAVATAIACNNCAKDLDVALVNLSKGDKIQLIVDGETVYDEVIEEDLDVEYTKTPLVMESYCNGTDSILIRVLLNKIDTTIIINPSIHRKIYIGENAENEIFVLHTTVYGSSDFTID